MNDGEIVEGFLAGDRDATGTVRSWIHDVARHSAWGAPELVEDGAAEATLKLLMLLRAGNFRGESSLRTFASRVARYTMIDMLRRRRRTAELITEETVPRPTVTDLEQDYVARERMELFGRIVTLLDDKCRKLWELIFHDLLPYKEIAAQQGITITAVKMRAYHCKEQAIEIRKKLESPLPGSA